jgi:hypothetical protein
MKKNKKLLKALKKLYKPANIAVSQIICLGGEKTCQPCENREELAIALKLTKKIIKKYENN